MNQSKKGLIRSWKILGLLLVLKASFVLYPTFESTGQEIKADLLGFRFENLSENLTIVQGNSLLAATNPLSSDSQIKKVRVVVTAYSSSPWETDNNPFLTAAGTWVRDGIVANNLLPFGTKIRLPELYGDKIFVVEDRMNRKKGYYHLDIWFPSYWEAKNFGAKTTYVEILES